MANPGIAVGGADVRYAATYGNPYLRGSGPLCKHTYLCNYFERIFLFENVSENRFRS